MESVNLAGLYDLLYQVNEVLQVESLGPYTRAELLRLEESLESYEVGNFSEEVKALVNTLRGALSAL